jgi:hypothetical protein
MNYRASCPHVFRAPGEVAFCSGELRSPAGPRRPRRSRGGLRSPLQHRVRIQPWPCRRAPSRIWRRVLAKSSRASKAGPLRNPPDSYHNRNTRARVCWGGNGGGEEREAGEPGGMRRRARFRSSDGAAGVAALCYCPATWSHVVRGAPRSFAAVLHGRAGDFPGNRHEVALARVA